MVDDEANSRMELLIRQMCEKQHVDEKLKKFFSLVLKNSLNTIQNILLFLKQVNIIISFFFTSESTEFS
ncbi:hypothetical protein [Clostridioides mangenotii]|uniref:hypothetical protein n=1 Tax=Metaclostridioides mangenotii TaxID=1540 RepID=UPI00163B1C9A